MGLDQRMSPLGAYVTIEQSIPVKSFNSSTRWGRSVFHGSTLFRGKLSVFIVSGSGELRILAHCFSLPIALHFTFK